MDKKELLARLENAIDMFGVKSVVESLTQIDKTYDAMMRFEGGQVHYFYDFLEKEAKRTERFSGYKTLANDKLGYQGTQILAILNHPCQRCAVDPQAWHTRPAFCKHKYKKLVQVIDDKV